MSFLKKGYRFLEYFYKQKIPPEINPIILIHLVAAAQENQLHKILKKISIHNSIQKNMHLS